MSDENYEKLNALIRAGAERYDLSPENPGEETILAYLEGNATQRQTEELQNALRSSVTFRREFKKVLEDYQEFEKVVRETAANEKIILPRKLSERIGSEYSSNSGESIVSRLALLLKSLLSARLVQLALVGVTAVVVFLMRSEPQVVEVNWSQQREVIERVNLKRTTLRGVSSNGVETPKIAALQEFSSLGRYDEGTNKFEPERQSRYGVFSRFLGSVKAVEFVDRAGGALGEILFDSRQALEEDLSDLQLWSLNLETYSLSTAPLADIKHSIALPDTQKSNTLLAITYRRGRKYYPLGGVALIPEE